MPRVSFRNLRRWTFATIAIASLVLCLATVGLWVRSWFVQDKFGCENTLVRRKITSFRGSVSANRITTLYVLLGSGARVIPNERTTKPFVKDARWKWEVRRGVTARPSFQVLDFEFSNRERAIRGTDNGSFVFRDEYLRLPHWSLALLFAIVPTSRRSNV